MQPNATPFKLFAASIYELLLLLALWMLYTWIFVWLFGEASNGYKRYGLQLVLWIMTGAYFVWCWCKSGQTLATQTWKIKLVNQQGNVLSPKQAIYRYALASLSLLICGLGYLWALVDKQGLFLHDRLLRTRFVQLA